jgi:hypothetical protein
MLFSKEHLTGLYNWAPDQETLLFTDSPTRRTFDRYNGDQVLFIINLLLDASESFSIEDGKKIEALIINKLPFDPCSELTVYNWLQKAMMVNA